MYPEQVRTYRIKTEEVLEIKRAVVFKTTTLFDHWVGFIRNKYFESHHATFMETCRYLGQ